MKEAKMSETQSTDAGIKAMGDQIANLTLKEAVQLAEYMKEAHGIEAASGGFTVSTGAINDGTTDGKEPEQSTYDIILSGVPDATKKIAVIKEVRAAIQLGLKEAKEMVDGAPKTIKENVPKDEAEKIKKIIEDAGGKVDLK